ncbi:unnamed protein product [Owenia fusiformis]|uniref:Uncharacterized protein n=1 Tax=Owenia fusiformis TaxID=6347 RepID=A0A8S4N7G2_OWEFU|nr:unnamed protein product [Owenia fusiformis]
MLIAKSNVKGGLPYAVFTKLFDALVSPITSMLHGAGIWGIRQYSEMNTVQNKAARYFLGVGRRAPNGSTKGDICWTSVFTKQRVEVTRLWCRLKNMATDRTPKHISKWSFRHHKSWENLTRKMLQDLDFTQLINNDTISRVKCHHNEVKEACIRADHVEWHNC